MEELAAGLTAWIQAAMDAHAVEFLQTSTVELQNLEARRDVPDVCEGDVGELTAPLGGDADTTTQGHDGVAQALTAVEAFVRVRPDAVHRVSAFRFSQDILETHL
ncbi:hypothetical protein PoB_005556400 [Plakobranchus ocellatus]|uniref:Uncharacterized protein n=1 Tax=Plakobranchus ocellatus TaxID=259542 RepID=A0AAV4C915_9GAST|nr:hypothetical protein PoB_005556400 [Plakobranchus ocellatus]